MSEDRTTNLTLSDAERQFIQDQVASGRYHSASEVVRDALRLLQEAEHRRLLEKWLREGLTDEERDRLPPQLLERARQRIRALIDEGVRSGEEYGWRGPDAVLEELDIRRRSRSRKRSA